MLQRSQFQLVEKRMNERRQFIQVLFGPRQVGKTTLLTQLIKSMNIPTFSIAADNVPATDTQWLENQWELARLKLAQSGATELLLVIDEIQKIANWSEAAKKMWDEDTAAGINIKVIVSGSSRLLLQQGLTESMAGRFETIYMGHWSYTEMAQAFGWSEQQYAWFGGYPGPANLIEDENRWKKYVCDALIETSISKDILMLTRIDKPALLKRLFELGCLYSGQMLSFTKIMGQLSDAGNTTTLANYLKILDAACLLTGLEKYSPNVILKRSSSPKFQVYNTALISAQHHETLDEVVANPTAWGRIVESAIGAHLINQSHAQGYSVQYWRNGNDEMDFVISNKRKVVGIEVKIGKIRPAGSSAFRKQTRADKVIMVGKDGLPWQEFLHVSPATLF